MVDARYYAYKVSERAAIRSGGTDSGSTCRPAFGWGNRIMGTAGVGALPGPPNQVFPGFLNINRTQDVAVSMTKVWDAHTFKAGFYNNHSFKAQNTGAGGVANLGFQGYVNFGNDTNNALDTGFGYRQRRGRRVHAVPAAVEADRRQHDLQQHGVLPPGQLEGEQPVDARLRHALHPPAAAARPVPADVELLPGTVVASACAAALHCRAATTARRSLQRQRARTRWIRAPAQILTAPGAANTQAAIGTVVPGTGNLNNGVRQAGDGIAKTSYVWPKLVLAPRFGLGL